MPPPVPSLPVVRSRVANRDWILASFETNEQEVAFGGKDWASCFIDAVFSSC